MSPTSPVGPAYAEPTAYPQLQRTAAYRPWQPVLGTLVLLASFFVLASFVLIPLLLVALAVQTALTGQDFGDAFTDAASFSPVTAASMLWLNLTLASGTLVAAGLTLWLHRLRPGWLVSVVGRVRWRLLRACLGLSVVVLVVSLLIGSLLPGADELGETGRVVSGGAWDGAKIALAVVILLTTPLQALGEEVVFRGYLMQALGSFFGSRWGSAVAVVGTSVVFALAHGAQNPPLFFDRLAFGLLAGYLVVRTGGLEAGIALHVLNNLVAFGAALAFGDVTESLTVSSVPWSNIVVTVVQNGLYLVLVLAVFRRYGLSGRTASTAPSATPAAAQSQARPDW